MHFIFVGIEAISLIVGSMVAAFLSCLGAWHVFRRAGRPVWAPVAVIVVALALLILPAGEFARMTAVLMLLMVVPFWLKGRGSRWGHA